ncbi:DUF397 domain-containing protein [Frankia sp. CNm7]|uniref:DUF397 domain-containing protein n=1 Tax=Frankia nepalensis TaxID=1836974 RepID=A0A937RCQ3_9ACTN|nr:DUF397 domain-containing protein [Frankia nepalensis]MBL7498817.1 DUF397 domain-containing protein [Frankia nepalensis]MBL7508622.1 DUF397 domain-containing protein [Frankia nepalensis]MBL7517460.1 DUF397 domain-containing protein [Frankia nepalensis]MBL7629706.1 DUF397 domain-containing protein [Frankia nepalensis]
MPIPCDDPPCDDPPAWRRPSAADPKTVDSVEAAWRVPGVAVVLRGSLSQPTLISSGAWAEFLAAVKRGEYDDLPRVA